MPRAITIFFSVIVLFKFVEAGVRVGNGGNSVICYADAKKTKVTSIELFDFWEQGQIHKLSGGPSLGPSSLSLHEKVAVAIRRVEKFDPVLAEEIATVAYSITDNLNAFLVTQSDIPEIKDANPKVIPANSLCEITQFAVQWQETDNGQRRFFISREIFENPFTDNDARAGLILHEAMYRYALIHGAKNSDGVRAFNYLASSEEIEQLTLPEYVSYLDAYGLNGARCKAVDVEGQSFYFKEQNALQVNCFRGVIHFNDQIRSGYLPDQLTYDLGTKAVNLVKGRSYFEVQDLASTQVFESNDWMWRQKDLHIQQTSAVPNRLLGHFFRFDTPILRSVSCHKNIVYNLKTKTVSECTINPQPLNLAPNLTLSLHQKVKFDGQESSVYLRDPLTLEIAESRGIRITIDPAFPVRFNQNGMITYGSLLSPLIIDRDGMTGEMSTYQPAGGKLKFNLTAQGNPHLQGRRISVDTPARNVFVKICKGLHPSLQTFEDTVKKIYVTAPEVFYSVKSDRLVSISDGYVDVLTDLICVGEMWVSPTDL